jgi:hypothetical protein
MPGRNKKAWWQCEKGHDWQAVVKSRVKGTECPFCKRKVASKEYNLQVINPKLSKEWHPVRNGHLTPNNVLPNSAKKVWWLCDKNHEYQSVIQNRTRGCGCPHCAGRLPLEVRNLSLLNPVLSEQWHPTKNGRLTPKDVFSGAHKKVWWQCKEGHEWQAFVFSRNKGAGCPYCCHQKRLSA